MVVTQFQYLNEGNTEAQDKLAEAYLYKQISEGIAARGVISGLGVTQTATASGSVVVGAGAGIVQVSRLSGADRLINDTDYTLDVFTANPMGGTPRHDIVVFDSATLSAGSGGIRSITGTPSATPSDPTVPSSAVPLFRLRHDASATTIPASALDDLRTFTNLFGVEQFGAWTNLTITGSNWSAVPGIPLQARLIPGNRVEITGAVLAGAITNINHVIATLPTGMRPSVTRYLPGHVTSDTKSRIFNPYVLSTGELRIDPAYANGTLVANAAYPLAGVFPL